MRQAPPDAPTLLDELDSRQDELLSQLDELNRRIEDVLRDFTAAMPHQYPLAEG